jgi:hypothetical protein
MRPHGRAKVSSRNPNAFGVCDRCGFLYNHNRLQWQFDYAGAGLINKRILVCDTCTDTPQQQLRAIILPADPTPILNPRVQDYVSASTDYRTTQGNTVNAQTGIPVIGGDTRQTNPTALPIFQYGFLMLELQTGFIAQEGDDFPYGILLEEFSGFLPSATYLRVTQQTGEPEDGLNPQPGTDPNAPGNDDPGLPYENVVVPLTGEDDT